MTLKRPAPERDDALGIALAHGVVQVHAGDVEQNLWRESVGGGDAVAQAGAEFGAAGVVIDGGEQVDAGALLWREFQRIEIVQIEVRA